MANASGRKTVSLPFTLNLFLNNIYMYLHVWSLHITLHWLPWSCLSKERWKGGRRKGSVMEGRPNPQAQIFWSSSLLAANRGLSSRTRFLLNGFVSVCFSHLTYQSLTSLWEYSYNLTRSRCEIPIHCGLLCPFIFVPIISLTFPKGHFTTEFSVLSCLLNV